MRFSFLAIVCSVWSCIVVVHSTGLGEAIVSARNGQW